MTSIPGRTLMLAMLAAFALASWSLLGPAAALADETEQSSDHVVVTVEITPHTCLPNCDGGAGGGENGGTGTLGVLPATGIDFSAPLVWVAVALLAAGLVLVLQWRQRRIRESPLRSGFSLLRR